MAVDTAAKRISIKHHGCPWRSLLPPPDGSNTEGDRLHGLHLYSGISTASFPGRKEFTMPHSISDYTLTSERPDFTLPLSLPEVTTGDE